MKVATLKEARSRLNELVVLAEQGEIIIIRRNGKAAVRLTIVGEPELELSPKEVRKLNAWADNERAAGRTRISESAAAYAVRIRAKRVRKGKSR